MSKALKDKTFREILAFSLIPFGTSTIYGIMGTALNLYFTDVLGLSLAMTSIILSATRIMPLHKIAAKENNFNNYE